MTVRRVIPLIVLVGAPLALAACTSGEPARIQLAGVQRGAVSEVVEAPATVSARASATLRTTAQGTVAKLYVRDGDQVKKGQILAKVDSPAAEDQLKQARKAQSQAAGGGFRTPSLRLGGSGQVDKGVRKSFADARKAAEQIEDVAARQQVLASIAMAEANYEATKKSTQQLVNQVNAGLGGLGSSMSSLGAAQRTQAEAAVKSAERTVDGLTIKAPFDGVAALGGAPGVSAGGLSGLLGQLPPGAAAQIPGGAAVPPSGGAANGTAGGGIAIGVPVASGDAIVTVTDVSEITLTADVDETDVLLVERGVPAQAEFDAVPGATYPAKVSGVGVTPKESTGGGVTYQVRLTLDQGTLADGTEAPRPRPGMSAVLRLTVREVPDAVAVPSAAVVTSGKDSVVWVIRDGKAQRRVVKLGAQGESTVEILSGVGVGERVVIKGADSVKVGQEVK